MLLFRRPKIHVRIIHAHDHVFFALHVFSKGGKLPSPTGSRRRSSGPLRCISFVVPKLYEHCAHFPHCKLRLGRAACRSSTWCKPHETSFCMFAIFASHLLSWGTSRVSFSSRILTAMLRFRRPDLWTSKQIEFGPPVQLHRGHFLFSWFSAWPWGSSLLFGLPGSRAFTAFFDCSARRF